MRITLYGFRDPTKKESLILQLEGGQKFGRSKGHREADNCESGVIICWNDDDNFSVIRPKKTSFRS